MMNILHISTTMDWRGGDVQMLTSFNLFKDQKEINQLVLCRDDSALSKVCAERKIPFVTAPKKYKFSISFIKRIIQIVRERKIDIVHVHDSKAHSAASAASIFTPHVKIVLSQKRDNPIRNSFFRRLKYNSHSLVNIICLSNAIKNVFDGILNDPGKAIVIYDGIDINHYSSKKSLGILHRDYQLTEDTLIIGNAAALVGQKDIYTFLDAAKIILQTTTHNIIFIILGEGILAESLKDYSVELGIANKIIFTGFRNDFAEILPEFNLLMMSSESEGLPLTLLSAFAAKVPVVSTSAGGIGEVIDHGITGMLSPIKKPFYLAKNALSVIENQQLCELIIANAYKMVYEKFTLDIMRKNYTDFYKMVFDNRK